MNSDQYPLLKPHSMQKVQGRKHKAKKFKIEEVMKIGTRKSLQNEIHQRF